MANAAPDSLGVPDGVLVGYGGRSAPAPSLTVSAGASSGTAGGAAIAGPTISAPGGNSGAVGWSISSTPSGVTATPASGTLAPGGSVTPTLSALTAAIYAITVANTSGGSVSGSAGNVQFYSPTPPPPAPSPPADWTSRTTTANTVWAHRFDSDAEITAFTTTPAAGRGHAGDALKPFRVSDPVVGNAMRFLALGARLAADFPASGGVGPRPLVIDNPTYWPDPATAGNYYVHLCNPDGGQDNNLLLVTAKSGATLTVTYIPSTGQPFSTTQRDWVIGDHVGHQSGSNWTRLLSALKGDSNGRGVDDHNGPGLTLRSTEDQTNFPHGSQAFGYGWYGHPDEQAAFPTWRPSDYGAFPIDSINRSNLWDGDEFYIQWRQRVDPRFLEVAADIDRTSTDGRFGRKVWMLQAEMTVPQQITGGYAPSNRFGIPDTLQPPFSMAAYSFGGGLAGRRLAANLDGSGSYQPGSAWAATALPSSFLPAGSAYEVQDGEWVTFHLRVKPGKRWSAGNPSATGVRNTVVEMQIARERDTAYTTVFSMSDQAIVYGSSGPNEDTWTTALPGYNAMVFTGYLNIDLGSVPPKAAYYVDIAEVVMSRAPIPVPLYEAPTWLPAAGAVTSYTSSGAVVTNDFADVVSPHYNAFWSKKIVNDYSTGVPAPNVGAYGACLFYGGGHAGTNDNSVIGLVLAKNTMTFARLANPTNWLSNGTDATAQEQNSIGNALSVLDATYGDAPPAVDAEKKPASAHSYGVPVVVPPEGGGAAMGSLFVAFKQGYLHASSANIGGASILSIASASTPTSNVWSRATSTVIGSSGNIMPPGFGVYVHPRKSTFVATRNAANTRWFDHTINDWVFGTSSGFTFTDGSDTSSGAMVYVETRGLLLSLQRVGTSLQIKYMNVEAQQPTVNGTATLSATVDLGTEAQHWWANSAFWCTETRRLILFAVRSGGAQDTGAVYEVEIPQDLTASWTVTRRAFTSGSLTVPSATWQRMSYFPRWRAAVALFNAVDSGTDTVTVFRPHGT